MELKDLLLSKKWILDDNEQLHVELSTKEYAEIYPERSIDVPITGITGNHWILQHLTDLHNQSLEKNKQPESKYPRWYEDTRHVGCYYYNVMGQEADNNVLGYFQDGMPNSCYDRFYDNDRVWKYLVELPGEPEAVKQYREKNSKPEPTTKEDEWPRWFEFMVCGHIQYVSFDTEDGISCCYTVDGNIDNDTRYSEWTYKMFATDTMWRRIYSEPGAVKRYREKQEQVK